MKLLPPSIHIRIQAGMASIIQTSGVFTPRKCYICHDPRRPLVSGLSEARCQELDSSQPPDYESKHDNELRAALEYRKVNPDELTGRLQYVERLEVLEQEDREKYQTARDNMKQLQLYLESLKTRPNRILKNEFKTEKGRRGFCNPPSELRNEIYELALFSTHMIPEAERLLPECNDLWEDARTWALQPRCPHHSPSFVLPQVRFLSTLGVLSSLDQQVREEARSLFWPIFWGDYGGGFGDVASQYRYDVSDAAERHPDDIEELDTKDVVKLTTLTCRYWDARFGNAGAAAFHGSTISLGRWQGLQQLTLYVHIYHVFGSDIEQLRREGGALSTPHFEMFATALEALPQLQSVEMVLQRLPKNFDRDMFRGVKEDVLYTRLYERLNANHLSRSEGGEPRKHGNIVVWLRLESGVDIN